MPRHTSSSQPAAPVENRSVPSGTQRRRQRKAAGPANANANVTPVHTTPANQAGLGTVSAVNTIETVTRTTQTSIQMFNRSRHTQVHGSSLSSVGGDDRRSTVYNTYNYNVSLSNITFAGNAQVSFRFQDGGRTDSSTETVCSQTAVLVESSRGPSDSVDLTVSNNIY
ncbi:hypothetical protein D9758_017150 [Tetrapyrgos nigripes]|uniref:Uncharacterized protein n=1 Tax=Tetrapyrgos nigripes TaxID=182062 RepID=A0A8H5BT87_9AGAR|nr:hypothetical protein D9758_017150 [Tetrapyrgos nigripes]